MRRLRESKKYDPPEYYKMERKRYITRKTKANAIRAVKAQNPTEYKKLRKRSVTQRRRWGGMPYDDENPRSDLATKIKVLRRGNRPAYQNYRKAHQFVRNIKGRAIPGEGKIRTKHGYSVGLFPRIDGKVSIDGLRKIETQKQNTKAFLRAGKALVRLGSKKGVPLFISGTTDSGHKARPGSTRHVQLVPRLYRRFGFKSTGLDRGSMIAVPKRKKS